MIDTPAPKVAHINKAAFELLSIIEKKELGVLNDTPMAGSLAEADHIQLGEATNISASKRDYSGRNLNISWIRDGDVIGISEDNYRNVEKLISTLIGDSNLKAYASEEFIRDQLHEWLIETYINGRASQPFFDYLLLRLDESVSEFQVHVPVNYLHVDEKFRVGLAEITYYTQEEIAEFDLAYRQRHSLDTSPYSDKKLWHGAVFCSCVVKAEPILARQLALDIQSSAIDVLIITSETLGYPEFDLSFNLDSRITRNRLNATYLFKNSDPTLIHPQHSVAPTTLQINPKVMERMKQYNFETFSAFLRNKDALNTELGQLIKNGISGLAEALTERDLHWRITQLFTVIEALLLPNSDSPVQDSIRKYCPRIVTKDVADRKLITVMLTKMYAVRSAMVHHAKRRKFEIADLSQLQRVANWLCRNLIIKLDKYQTKSSVLNEIDEAILAAG